MLTGELVFTEDNEYRNLSVLEINLFKDAYALIFFFLFPQSIE